MIKNLSNRILQFGEITKQDGLSDAIRRAIDFGCNRITRILISQIYSQDILPKDHIGGKVLFIEAVGKHDGWGLGDGIFRLPSIEMTSEKFGGNCDVLTREFRTPLHKGNTKINQIHKISNQRSYVDILSLIKELRNHNYTHIVNIDPSWRMFIFMFLIKKNAQLLVRSVSLSETKNTNLIELFSSKVASVLGIENNSKLKPNLYPRVFDEFDTLFHVEKKYIGINIGAKSGLRHFRNWDTVIQKLVDQKKIGPSLCFVLVGKEGVDGLDNKIIKILGAESVLNFCNILTLEQLYYVISRCNGGFIGMDGGNINAAIALHTNSSKKVIPIYTVVQGSKRLPKTHENFLDLDCPNIDGRCFNLNLARGCIITGQLTEDNTRTPPCLEGNKVVDKVYEKLLLLM